MGDRLRVRLLMAAIPAQEGDRVRLELRCHGWVPQALNPGSHDPCALWVQVQVVAVKAAGAPEAVFSANSGQWLAGG